MAKPTKESLVVVSKVKKYIKGKVGFNTSIETIDALTAMVEEQLDTAIKSAQQDGRKTVMARDFKQTLLTTNEAR